MLRAVMWNGRQSYIKPERTELTSVATLAALCRSKGQRKSDAKIQDSKGDLCMDSHWCIVNAQRLASSVSHGLSSAIFITKKKPVLVWTIFQLSWQSPLGRKLDLGTKSVNFIYPILSTVHFATASLFFSFRTIVIDGGGAFVIIRGSQQEQFSGGFRW